MERTGFGPRLGAGLIDVVISIVAITILASIFGIGAMGFLAGGSEGGFSLGMILISLIPLAYTSTEIFMAGTPGKKILKLAIRNDDGSVASQEQLIKRWAFKNSGSLLMFLATLTTFGFFSTLGNIAGLIVFVGCFFTLSESKLAFHDKFAKTAVYKVS